MSVFEAENAVQLRTDCFAQGSEQDKTPKEFVSQSQQSAMKNGKMAAIKNQMLSFWGYFLLVCMHTAVPAFNTGKFVQAF